MKARKSVPIVLVLTMALTMVLPGTAFAVDVTADQGTPAIVQDEIQPEAGTPDVTPPVEPQVTVTPAATEEVIQPEDGTPAATPDETQPEAPAAEKEAAAAMLAAPERAAEVRVSAAADDSKPEQATTIQKGVNKVAMGGTVIVENGTYNEIVNVDNSMIIKAASDKGATINGGFIIYSAKSNIAIGAQGAGFIINSTSGNGTLGAAISINSSASNCKVIGNTINVEYGYGIITAGDQKGHEFLGNTFTGTRAKALVYISRQPDNTYPDDPVNLNGSLAYSEGIVVSGNTFNGYADNCVILDAKNSPVTNNTFNANVAALGARLCVKVNVGFAAPVTGNKFTAVSGFSRTGLQFKDITNTWNLEAIRAESGNTFDQAVYFAGGYDKVDQLNNPIRGNYIYYYIQDAVDAAYSFADAVKTAEDTIYVGAGTYTEHVVIHPTPSNTRITLINRDNAKSLYSAIINSPNANDPWSLDIISVASHVEGFEIHGMYTKFADGSYYNKNKFTGKDIGAFIESNDLDTVRVATVSQNLFTGNKFGGLRVAAVRGDKTHNMTITGNTFTANGIASAPCGTPAVIAYGARIENSINVNIYDNNFNNNTGNGLELEDVNNNYVYDHVALLVKHNKIDNNGKGLLDSQAASLDVGNGIYAKNCRDIEVVDNYSITANRGNGVFFQGCDNITVSGNNDTIQGYSGIVGNGKNGVLFKDYLFPRGYAADFVPPIYDNMGLVKVIENTISSNGLNGVDGIDASSASILRNTVKDNGVGGVVNTIAKDATVSENVIDNNGKSSVGDGLSITVSNGVLINLNEIIGNSGIGIDLRKGDANINSNMIKLNAGGGIAVRAYADADIQKNNILQNGTANKLGGIYIKGFATVHYNNIVGNIPYGLKLDNTYSMNAARTQNSELPRYYTFNFWGDVSGPADTFQKPFADFNAEKAMGADKNLLGECNAIELPNTTYYRSVSVDMYAPWLTDGFEKLGVADEAGKTAEVVIPYAVREGWNFLSTANLLGVNSWSEIKSIGVDLDAALILGYDSAAKEWKTDADQLTFTPQNSYFVKMKSVDFIPLVIKMHTVNDMGWTVPVTKSLKEGWNLVAKADDNTDPMTVREVLSSASNTDAGWSYVIHPDIDYGYGRSQDDFTYTKDSTGKQYMFNNAGYWVYMKSNEILAGGTTSYVWDWDVNKINKLLSLTDKILNVTPITNP